MNDQERQVIDDIFRRLEQVANQPRDPGGRALHRRKGSPAALRALRPGPGRLRAGTGPREPQRRARAVAGRGAKGGQPRAAAFSPASSGAGLGGTSPRARARPGGAPAGQPSQPYGMPQGGMTGGPMAGGPAAGGPMAGRTVAGGPWGGMQQRGGGFLQSAMATAAGVAGGVMIANALSHAFGGDHGAGAAGRHHPSPISAATRAAERPAAQAASPKGSTRMPPRITPRTTPITAATVTTAATGAIGPDRP